MCCYCCIDVISDSSSILDAAIPQLKAYSKTVVLMQKGNPIFLTQNYEVINMWSSTALSDAKPMDKTLLDMCTILLKVNGLFGDLESPSY